MQTGKLDRGYGRLAASERFRLLVSAEARADSAEVERLLRSCPQLTYRMRDPALGDRLEGSFELTIAVLAALHEIDGKLNLITATDRAARILFTIAADNAEFEVFRITGVQPALRRAIRRERGRLRKMHRHVRETLRTEGATVAHAFAAVCRNELEVEPQQLVAAVAAPFANLFEQFLEQSPNREAVAAIQAELVQAWRSGIGEQPIRPEAK